MRRLRFTKTRADTPHRRRRPLAAAVKGFLTWRALGIAALVLGLLAMYGVGYVYLGRRDIIGDEWAHLKQAKDLFAFLRDGTEFIPVHPAIPGYHLVLALIGLISTVNEQNFYRAVSLALSVLTVPVFAFAARDLWGRRLLVLRTLQFVFMPLAFPFFFLLYTDVPSLLPLLLCFAFLQRRRYHAAGILAFLTIATRQNNVIWILMFLIFLWIREWNGWGRAALIALVRKSALMGASIAALGVFAVINGGLSLADKEAHPPSLHTGNLFTISLCFVLMMFPVILLQPVRFVRDLVERERLLLPAGVLSLFAYLATFRNDHGYNFDAWWLRNKVLIYVTSAPWLQTLYFFCGFAVAALICARTAFARREHYLFYPFAILYLGASWLVEPRYFFAPLALFLLFRRMERWWVELGILVVFIVEAAILGTGAWKGWFLP